MTVTVKEAQADYDEAHAALVKIGVPTSDYGMRNFNIASVARILMHLRLIEAKIDALDSKV